MTEKIILNRKLFGLCTVIFITTFVFIFFLFGDPRMADGNLEFYEALWWEIVLIMMGVISILLVWTSSIRYSIKHGHSKWTILVMLIWPLSFLYGFLINTKNFTD